ncbi:MAG: WG repeat-containing protein [Clostridia bacterium]|nr:WG repeat-containing protein [Clostridia bacterium]
MNIKLVIILILTIICVLLKSVLEDKSNIKNVKRCLLITILTISYDILVDDCSSLILENMLNVNEVLQEERDDRLEDSKVNITAIGSNVEFTFMEEPNNRHNTIDLSNSIFPKEKNGKWGYVNEYGETVILFQYDYANLFSEGIASVRKGYKWAFIDCYGNEITEFKYDGLWSFIDGLAPAFRDGHWGFIDREENIIIPFKYKNITLSSYEGKATYFDENNQPIKY